MIVEHWECPHCGTENRLEIPEDFEDRVEKFLKGAPATTVAGLLALAAGRFIARPVGYVAAGVMLAASLYTDGTAKCKHCGRRFRVRDLTTTGGV